MVIAMSHDSINENAYSLAQDIDRGNGEQVAAKLRIFL